MYPLNALIKSQRDRLTAWSEPFRGQIRYCLYNGETPELSPPRRARTYTCEVLGRDELRSSPPPLLVTNATMLEYLLIRPQDQRLLAASQGQLRWIVIDEAHSYIGSQAAELTLLLRRVLHGFGVRAQQVRFVATSATLGSGADTEAQLRRFLAAVAGVDEAQVTVLVGAREAPLLPPSRLDTPLLPLTEVEAWPQAQRAAWVWQQPRLLKLRAQLIQRPHLLSELAQLLSGDATQRLDALRWLDICTQARNLAGLAFLPLRGHVFQRALAGLWACANLACAGRDNRPLG